MYESRAAFKPTPKPIVRRGMTFGLWVQWIVACVLGAVIGQTLAQLLAYGLVPDATEGNLYTWGVTVLAGALMGACIGALQGAVLGQRMGIGGWRDWVIASMIGGGLRWAIAAPIGQFLLLNIRLGWKGAYEFNMGIFCFSTLVFAALSGAAFAIPQALVLKRRLGETVELGGLAWVLANVAGGLFSFPFISLSGNNEGLLAAMTGIGGGELTSKLVIVAAITWAVTACTTTLPLRDRLNRAAQ